jgi:hypothetical protein
MELVYQITTSGLLFALVFVVAYSIKTFYELFQENTKLRKIIDRQNAAVNAFSLVKARERYESIYGPTNYTNIIHLASEYKHGFKIPEEMQALAWQIKTGFLYTTYVFEDDEYKIKMYFLTDVEDYKNTDFYREYEALTASVVIGKNIEKD